MGFTNRITWETLRSVDSATLTGVYVPIGGPLLHQSYIFKMVNNSSVLVTVSIDGLTDIDVLPAGSFFLYDESEGNQAQPSLPAGTQIYIKGPVGTGLVYLVNQYLVVN
jgi:hypothetical protein